MHPDIPEPIFGQRFALMWKMIIHSLADRERANEQRMDQDLFVSNLIDSATGGLIAPVSAVTATKLT